MAKHREVLGDKIWNLTKVSQVLMEENWTRDVTAEMKKFEKEIVHAMKVSFEYIMSAFPILSHSNKVKRLGWK